MSVEDVHERWQELIASLASEGGILMTRDGEPFAKLLPPEPEDDDRPRYDPVAQKRWREEMWGKGVMMDSLSGLLEDREDRELISPEALAAWLEKQEDCDENGG